MSILIKGMEMPMRCADCWLMDGNDGWCSACRGKHLVCDYRYGIKDRPEWCPLVPIPPHGRLIDADALDDVLMKLADNTYTPKVFASWLTYEENAPTIIPASEEIRNG